GLSQAKVQFIDENRLEGPEGARVEIDEEVRRTIEREAHHASSSAIGEADTSVGAQNAGISAHEGIIFSISPATLLALGFTNGKRRSQGEEPLDDRNLVERFLKTREEAAFRALYRAHSSALHGLLLRLTNARTAEAEDALQETWLRAVERLEGFRWESSLRTWLSGIAVRVALEQARKRDPQAENSDQARAAASSGREPALDLRQAVSELANG